MLSEGSSEPGGGEFISEVSGAKIEIDSAAARCCWSRCQDASHREDVEMMCPTSKLLGW